MTLKGRLWTLAELNAHVEVAIDDISNVRWLSTEVDRAIKAAIRASSHVWFEERLDATNTYGIAVQRYTLPPACESVLEVLFAPIAATTPRKLVPMSMWRVENRELVFLNVYTAFDTKAMYIYYTVRPANLLTIGLDDLATTLDSAIVTSATSTWITSGVRPGDTFVITTGADAGTYYVSTINLETSITLHTTMTATAGGILFTVEPYTDMPFDYIVNFAMAWLYELAGRNRPGVEVSEVVQWANYYRQLADLDLRRNARRPRPIKRY